MKFALFIAGLLAVCDPGFGQTTMPTTQPDSDVLTGDRISDFYRNEARKLNRPYEEYRATIARELGNELLMDRRRDVALIYSMAHDGKSILITLLRASPTQSRPSFQYWVSDQNDLNAVSYGINELHAQPGISVHWQDLNADGVFDMLSIYEDHNELLNLDKGQYILLKGVWTRAERDPSMPYLTVKVGGNIYHFEKASGLWVTP